MRVVISGYVGKKITGIGRNLINLIDNTKNEHEYIIYTNEDMKKDFSFKNPRVTVKTYPVSKNSSIKNLLWTTFVFPFVVLKEHADRALIPNFSLLLFKFCPTVVIIHDLIEFRVDDKFSPLKMFYRKRIADPSMVKRSDRIITVSENSKRDLIKFLNAPENKISVIYNGVDQNQFYRMDPNQADRILEKKGWPKDFILYVGTIDHPGKNAISIIKAFELLKKDNKYEGKCVLAGMPGKGWNFVKTYIDQSEYKDQIIVTGFVSDKELVALYSKCDSFVFVSCYEGFGIPPLEALSCGAKVIVSNSSSLPEVVGNIGKKVDPFDLISIANAIYESFHLSYDEQYKVNVQNHLKNYNWEELSKKFEMVLLNYK